MPESLLALKGSDNVASTRRLGPRNSETSNAILDATEKIMREEGYAAVSSRRVAEVAGIRQGLVYYYFETMDDLLLAAFKRRIDLGLARLERLVELDNAIEAIWQDMTHTVDARMAYEFNALANHHEGIRDEVNRYLNHARNIEANAIARQAQERGIDLSPFTPAALAFLMYSASITMARESSSGMSLAHDDVHEAVRWLLAKFA